MGADWDIHLRFTPEGRDGLHAAAVLTAGLDRLAGHGETRKHPSDPNLPMVAAQLAASRALRDLATQLEELACAQLEPWTTWTDGQPIVLPAEDAAPRGGSSSATP